MSIEQCKATLSDGRLVLENTCIRREFDWNGGHLVSRRIDDPRTGRGWVLTGQKPDCEFPGQREYNEREPAAIALWNVAGRRVAFKTVLGQAADFQADADAGGRVTFHLPGRHTFDLYEYTVTGEIR